VAQNDKTSTKIKHASLYLFIRNKDRHLVFFTLWKYRRILCQLLKLRFGYTFYLHFCVLLKILINYFTNSINKLKLLIPPPLFGAAAQRGPMASSCSRSLGHTQWRTAFGRAPLDEWSARIRDLYLTTRNTYNRHTSLPPRWYSNPQSQQRKAADPRLRPRGRWDRLFFVMENVKIYCVVRI